MLETIKCELRIFFKMKSVWIIGAIVLVLSSFLVFFSFNNAKETIEFMKQYQQSVAQSVDGGEMQIIDYFVSFHPNMFINNIMGTIVGLGALAFPILISIYCGFDYRQGTISLKASKFGLTNILLSKIFVINIFFVCFFFVYIVYFCVVYNVCWNIYLKDLSESYDIIQYISVVEFHPVLSILFVLFLMNFFCAFSMLLTYLFKNGIAGIVWIIIYNYLPHPSINFLPSEIISYTLNNVLYVSPNNMFSFPLSESIDYLPIYSGVILLFVYLFIIVFSIFILSKKQKN